MGLQKISNNISVPCQHNEKHEKMTAFRVNSLWLGWVLYQLLELEQEQITHKLECHHKKIKRLLDCWKLPNCTDSKCITLKEHHVLQNDSKTADRQKIPSYIFTKNSYFLLCFLSPANTFCKTNLKPTNTHRNTHLPCPEFPVCCQAVSCIHEDFGNAQSSLDGLQLEAQQVAFNPESFECLTRAGKKATR